jgi:hypothetical protein
MVIGLQTPTVSQRQHATVASIRSPYAVVVFCTKELVYAEDPSGYQDNRECVFSTLAWEECPSVRLRSGLSDNNGAEPC